MPRPQDSPNLRTQAKGTLPKKPLAGDLVAGPFNIPPAVGGAVDGFMLVQATALRDRLESAVAPAPSDPTAPPSSTSADLPTLYRWSNLKESLLKGPRRSDLWDVVTNYRAGDRIDAPDTIITTEITGASGSIRKLNPGQINAKGVGGEAFAANTARAFLYAGSNKGLQNGVFVVFNDNRPGYQHKSDSLIFLEGFSFGASAGAGPGVPGTVEAGRSILFWQTAPIAPAGAPAPAA